MPEWFKCLLLVAFLTLCAARTLTQIWCLAELRKWRTVPELRGIDWLDIVYRLERDLGVRVSASDFENLQGVERINLSAGQLWELAAAKLRSSGRQVPSDGWERVVATLSEALNVRRTRVTPSSRLFADLGMVDCLD